MEFLQLTYFCHAAKCESFSEVARAFRVPPSSVSLSVKRLEEELGASLFDRHANRLSLNEKGRVFLEKVEAIFALLDEGKDALRGDESDLGGEVRVLIRANRRIVTEQIAAFRKMHPGVFFSIHHKPLEHSESYHIIISDTKPKTGRYTELPLVREEMMLALPKEHPLCENEAITGKMLARERLIGMTRGSDLREYTDQLLRALGVSPKLSIECDDPYYVREYIKMGLGVAVVPSVSWANQFPEGVELRRIETGFYRNSSLYLSSAASSAACAFAAFMAKGCV